jgi:hypothetical protein
MELTHRRAPQDHSRTTLGLRECAEFRRRFFQAWSRANRAHGRGREQHAARSWRTASRLAGRIASQGLIGPSRPASWPPGPWIAPPASPTLQCPRRPEGGHIVGLRLDRGTYRATRQQLNSLLRNALFDLMIDEVRGEIHILHEGIKLENCPTLVQLLARLVRAGGGPIAAADLYEATWGYKPARSKLHNRIQVQFCDLRRTIQQVGVNREIVTSSRAGYRLAHSLRYVLVESVTQATVGSQWITVQQLLSEKGYVENRSYRKVRNISRASAARELRHFVQKGVLYRQGSGRSVRYRSPSRDV